MVWRHFLVGVIFWFNGMSCCVLKYFICCSKNLQCFDLTCLQKLCKLVYLFVQLEIWHLKDILSQTVVIPSMRKNFVKTDWSIETSQIPTLKFPPFLLFWIILNLWIQTYSLLFINENNCLPCFLYKNKP